MDLARPWRSVPQALDVVRGHAVPEAMVWQPTTLMRSLDELAPDLVVTQTIRMWNPVLTTLECPVLVDYVDQLSVSYEQRAGWASGWQRHAYRILGRFHARAEARLRSTDVIGITAGRRDAEQLDATWVPIVAPEGSTPTVDESSRPHDVVFFGSLNYPPNIEAIEWLAAAPGADTLRVLVAGRSGGPRIPEICAQLGWTYRPDFESVEWLAQQARVAAVPLVSAAGMQIKMLEAAAHGLPQVGTSMALQGFDLEFPIEVEDDPATFVDLLRALSEDPQRAHTLATAAQSHVQQHYSVSACGERLRRVLAANQPSENDGSTWWSSAGAPSSESNAGATSNTSTGSLGRAA
jgi:hypothetical protein